MIGSEMSLPKRKILVVDDEPLVCQSFRVLMHWQGHDMEEAHSGEEALEKFDLREFDLVFTDFCMPGMKGDQLARSIRARNETIPVVMVTAFPPRPESAHVCRTILKPFDAATIIGAIAELTP